MNLTEFRMRAMNDEVQMIEDFNFFEQKVASFKKTCIYRLMPKSMKF